MQKFLQSSSWLVFGVNRGMIMLAGWGVVVVAGLTTYSTLMRYVFNSPDIWTYPVSGYILCLIVFGSLAHTHQEGVHVRVDYFVDLLPRRLGLTVRICADIASSIFLAILAWQLWRLFSESLSRHRVDETTLAMPLALIQWVLPLGAVFLLLTHVLVVILSAFDGTYDKRASVVL